MPGNKGSNSKNPTNNNEILLNKKEMFSSILHTIPDGILVVSTDGETIYANETVKQIFKKAGINALSRPYEGEGWKCLYPDGKPLPKEKHPFYAVLRTKKPVTGIEYLLAEKSGRCIRLSVNAAPLKDFSGKIAAVVASINDVTGRAKIAQALADSGEKLLELIEKSVEPIFVADAATGKLIIANKKASLLIGKPQKDIIGRHFTTLHPPEHFRMVSKNFRAGLAHGATHTGVYVRHADGRDIPVEISTTAMELNGRKIQVAVFKDVSEREKAQEESQKAGRYFEIANSMLVVIDADARIVTMNKKGLELLGYHNEKEVIGRDWFNTFIPKDIRESTREVYKSLVSGGAKPVDYYENRVVDKKGRERLVAWRNAVLKDNKGRVYATVSSGEDITDRKSFETALVESEKKYRSLFQNMSSGFAFHKVITDKKGRPVDYEYIEVNDAYEKLTGLKRAAVQGRRVTKLIPGIKKDRADWIGNYGRVALAGQEWKTEQYSEALKKWFSITAYSPIRGYFVAVFDDISGRKTMERELRESEQQYKLLFNATNDAVIVRTMTQPNNPSKIIAVNYMACKMLGYTKKELLSQPPSALVADESKVTHKKIEELRKAGELVYERVMLTKSGKKIPVEISARLFYMQGREVILTAARDITERKNAQERAAEQAKVSTARAEIWKLAAQKDLGEKEIISRMLRIIGESLGAERVVHSKIIGKSFVAVDEWKRPGLKFSVIGIKAPADFQMSIDFKGQLIVDKELVVNSVPRQFKKFARVFVNFLAKNLGDKPAVVTPYHINNFREGQIVCTGYLEPVTRWTADKKEIIVEAAKIIAIVIENRRSEQELRKSEERYRLFADNVADVIWTIDTKLNYTYISPSVETAMGYGYKAEELIGRHISFNVPKSDIGEVMGMARSILERVAKNGKIFPFVFEMQLTHKGTGKRWIESTVNEIRDSKGKLLGYSGSSRDVTERKLSAIAVKESEERFRAFFDNFLEPVFLNKIDKNGRPGKFIEVNEAAVKKYGYSKSDFLKLGIPDITVEEAAARAPFVVKDAMKKRHVKFETYNMDKKGERFPVEVGIRHFRLHNEDFLISVSRDLTARKMAERAVKESEEKYRQLFDNAGDSLFLNKIDKNGNPGRFIEVNETACEKYGYTKSEFMNMLPGDILPKEYRNMVPERLKKALHEKHVRFETVNVGKGGKLFPVEIRMNYFRLRGEDVMLTAAHDIRDRKQAEELLKNSEEKYRELFNNATDAIFLNTLGDDGRVGAFIDINNVAIGMLGYSKAEFEKMTPRDITRPENLERYPAIGREIATKGRSTYEMQLLGKSGKTVSVENNSHGFVLGGKKVVLTVTRDITARKAAEMALTESEEKFRNIVDNMQDGLIVTEPGKVIYVNERLCEMLGYSRSEMMDIKMTDLVVAKDREYFLDMIAKMRKMGIHVDEVEYTVRKKDGEERFVSSRFSMVPQPGGGVRTYLFLSDITERKRAENALKESEEKFRNIVENMQDGLMVTEPGRMLYVSESFRKIFGYSKNEMTSNWMYEIIAEEDRPRFKKMMDENREKGWVPMEVEYAAIRKDGKRIHVRSRMSVVLRQGKTPRFYIFTTDVTQRKIAEEALADSEEKFRTLTETARAGMVIFSAKGIVLYANAFAKRVMGLTEIDYLGKSIFEFIDPAFREETAKRLKNRIEGKENPENFEIKMLTGKGGTRWFDYNGGLIVFEGQRAVLGTFTDINDRKLVETVIKESEERFRTLSEQSQIGIVIVQGVKPVYMNSAFKGIMGITDAEASQLNTANIFDRFHPEDLERTKNEIKLKKMAEQTRRYETRIITGAGEIKWVEVYVKDINYSGAPAEFHTVVDVTKLKETEAKMLESVTELKRSNKDLEQFAYVASHDLQEPLRMVSSYVQLLERRYRDKLDSDAVEFINFAVEGADRMQRLIKDLLTYSRIGSRGKEFAVYNFGEAVKTALVNLKPAVEETAAEVTCGQLPALSADDVQITQLFQNLIANAIKFRKKDEKPLIQISASKKGGEWVFCVKDNGIGIEAEYFEKIFVIFQRLHARSEYPGTGIGLAICKRIVERHGGKIWVESAKGEGASFYFTINT